MLPLRLHKRSMKFIVRLFPLLTIFCTSLLAAPPNVVMIISDDQAWTDYGFMGHKDIATPHLDKLVKRSALFRRGYVPTALCRPSLMTMATGLYVHQHNVSGNDPAKKPNVPKTGPAYQKLRAALIAHIDKHPTIMKQLGKVGYVSHQSGKWWEGNWSRGGFTAGMSRGFPERGGRHGDDGLKIGRDGMDPVFNFVKQARADAKPFFLWYAPFLPHTPHNPPDRLLKKYQTADRPLALAKYYAMCEWFDETCGELVKFIDDQGLADDTLFVYVCDNGWIQKVPDMDLPRGWRGGFAPRSKQSPNEGGVRTPIFFSWPGVIPPGDYPELVSSIDLMPTILAAAGAEIPAGLPGLNLMPKLRDGKTIGRERIFGAGYAHDIADIQDPEKSMLYRWCIQGDWKLLLTYDGQTGNYGWGHLRGNKGPQLYNLMQDPHENNNLAAARPDRVRELAGHIGEWFPLKTVQTQLNVEAPQ